MSLVKLFATMLPLVLLFCCVESRALFGIGSALGTLTSTNDSNGTSILAALALAHAHHTVNRLEQLAQLINLGQNVTASFITH
ncbi:hypothetical protein evm_005398 [Chilo suppressalis]|nr:hypothetical protein evm_005398 [Chilo suppressalis]